MAPRVERVSAKTYQETVRAAAREIWAEPSRIAIKGRGDGVALFVSASEAGHVAIDDIVSALTLLASVSLQCMSDLTWTFSGLVVRGADAADLLWEWQDGTRPPTLSIIRLEQSPYPPSGYRTVGLSSFVGHDLSMTTRPDANDAELLSNLVALTGCALILGPDYSSRPIRDQFGQPVRLSPPTRAADGSIMVSIGL